MAVYQEFKDNVALITGGAGGIGKAIAKKLGLNGCKIFIGDITKEIVDGAVAEIAAEGINADGLVVEITSEESVKEMVDACIKRYGKIDYLVAAAGIFKDKMFKDMTYEEWKQTVDINQNGVFLATHMVLPHMLENGYGSIILFGSQAGTRGSSSHAHYAATKAAMQGLTKSLVYEVADSGVRINCVAPGYIYTPMIASKTPEKIEQWKNAIPMKRFGLPEDVANVIAFLLSDDASYVSGQTININGGTSVNT